MQIKKSTTFTLTSQADIIRLLLDHPNMWFSTVGQTPKHCITYSDKALGVRQGNCKITGSFGSFGHNCSEKNPVMLETEVDLDISVSEYCKELWQGITLPHLALVTDREDTAQETLNWIMHNGEFPQYIGQRNMITSIDELGYRLKNCRHWQFAIPIQLTVATPE